MSKGIIVVPLFLLSIFFLFSGSFMNGQTRRALLVGINNYEPKVSPKTQCRSEWRNLYGCINDVEAVKGILITRFDFKPENIHVLKNDTATKKRILTDFRRYLTDNTSPGDICLFYYSGHGSRVKNSKSDEPDQMDETLVPADWYLGVGDIHDKELKKLFNRVLAKKAHLTVIVDACHSGSISRGIPVPLRCRSLPPNECDVAEPPDREKSPAERGALIFSAAQDFQVALETEDENNHCHGLFTWALLNILRKIPADEPSQNVLLKVKALMQSEGKSQEPNLEGLPEKTQKSILGIQTGGVARPLKVAVSRVWRQLIELQGGLAVGIRKGCELKKVDDKRGEPIIRVQVTEMHGLSRCAARVIQGDAKKIKVGDFFELEQWVAAREAPMQVFVPASDYSFNRLTRIAREIAEIRESPDIDWVEDPTVISPTHIISWHQSYWKLQPLNKQTFLRSFLQKGDGTPNPFTVSLMPFFRGFISKACFFCKFLQDINQKATRRRPQKRAVNLGRNPRKNVILKEILKGPSIENIKPRVFLQLPLSVELERTVRTDMEDYNHSIRISSSEQGIHYILVGRFTGKGIEYAWILPNMTQEEKQDFSLPIRTGWIPVGESKTGFQSIAETLTNKILQLVRIRAWFQLSSPPDNGRFPYQLALKNAKTGEITTTGPLTGGETYGLMLKADEARLKILKRIEKRYVYVFSIDSYGKGTLLFPRQYMLNTENCFPAGAGNQLETKIELGGKALFRIWEPFGMDTFILLTTTDAISHPWVLDFKGVRKEPKKGKFTPLEELFFDLSSLSRGARWHLLPMDWSIQRLPILSQSKLQENIE